LLKPFRLGIGQSSEAEENSINQRLDWLSLNRQLGPVGSCNLASICFDFYDTFHEHLQTRTYRLWEGRLNCEWFDHRETRIEVLLTKSVSKLSCQILIIRLLIVEGRCG